MSHPAAVPQDGTHLTTEQLGRLLDARFTGAASSPMEDDHLSACRSCAAEYESLHEALRLFRETTVAYANEQRGRVQRPSAARTPLRSAWSPALLWGAAGLLMMASVLPLQLQRQRAHPIAAAVPTSSVATKAESDEALLRDINREISASVPAPMQDLADPTGTGSSEAQDQSLSPRKN